MIAVYIYSGLENACVERYTIHPGYLRVGSQVEHLRYYMIRSYHILLGALTSFLCTTQCHIHHAFEIFQASKSENHPSRAYPPSNRLSEAMPEEPSAEGGLANNTGQFSHYQNLSGPVVTSTRPQSFKQHLVLILSIPSFCGA